jgi:hypothetical protein
LAGDAKSYAARLSDFREVGPLPNEAAKKAIVEPLLREKVSITPDAIDLIVRTKMVPVCRSDVRRIHAQVDS